MPAHPSRKCLHEENRSKVCGPCGKKLILGKKKISNFRLTENHVKLIGKLLGKKYDLNDCRFPTSICTTCRLTLSERAKNNGSRPLQAMPNYENIILPKSTRSSSASGEVCNCYIYLTGKSTSHFNNTVAPGVKKDLATKITVSNGLLGSRNSKVKELPKSRTSDSNQKESGVLKLCNVCKSEIHKGKKHVCSTRVHVVRANVMKLVHTLNNDQKEHVASKIINEKAAVVGEDSLTLRTRGRQKHIYLTEKKTDLSFSLENLDNYHTDTAHSARQMNRLATFIRHSAGRKSVPSNYSSHISERTKLLEDNYEISTLEFDTKNTKVKEKRPVIWTNAEKIVESVLEKRNFVGNYTIKVMADGGQGFFKVCLSIIPVTSEPDEDLYVNVPTKKRKLSRKIHASSPETSVKKLIMLCIVPDIKETYENVKMLFELIKINDISFKFVSDFKLLLIINGQQTATSTYPCPYCFVSLQELRKNSDEKNVPYESQLPVLKTFGDLEKDYKNFVDLGKKKNLSKNCYSTINKLLFTEDKDLRILEKCIIPELHVMQGFVNHLFWDGLVSLVGREKALLWPMKLNLISKKYHGEIFEGNACRILLKEADKLNDKEIYKDTSIFALMPYITAFKIMNKIVNSCFSLKRLEPIENIRTLITDLRKALLATAVSETLKIHVLLEHLNQCLEQIDSKQGLGLWSEQASESAHREFLKFWERRKVNLISHVSYPQRLKEATVEFSSLHI